MPPGSRVAGRISLPPARPAELTPPPPTPNRPARQGQDGRVDGGGKRTGWRWRWAALLAGAVPALAFPGLSVWVLGLVGLVPLLLVVAGAPTLRAGMLRMWFGGVGFFLAVDSW